MSYCHERSHLLLSRATRSDQEQATMFNPFNADTYVYILPQTVQAAINAKSSAINSVSATLKALEVYVKS